MALIPAGTFMMGCNPAVERGCGMWGDDPYHPVALQAFAIDLTKVTQVAYQQCIAAGVCRLPAPYVWVEYDPIGHPTFPMLYVTWHEAQTYCLWAGKRLPTEAEWEKAARGTDGRAYPWGNEPPDCSRYNCQNPDAFEPVGQYPAGASPYGLLDLVGNPTEWVNDWFVDNYYDISPAVDPRGPACGSRKGVRDGLIAGELYVSRRWGANGGLGTGFRCARSVP